MNLSKLFKWNFGLNIIFTLIIANIFAASMPLNSSAPQAINSYNLTNIDNSADDLNQLKRRLEVEKAQAELKKLRNPTPLGNAVPGSNIVENAQTTVNGVAIDQNGKKIAWLQFADGGSLAVNIGSKVGKYTVSDISMTGVTLSYLSTKRHSKPQTIFLKRVYYAPEKPKGQVANQHANSFFSPSPIITNANTSNIMVPPITK
jgi:hypothetical protein